MDLCENAYLVFQAAWAALTFCWAVSLVKGGKGGLDSVAMMSDCVITHTPYVFVEESSRSTQGNTHKEDGNLRLYDH